MRGWWCNSGLLNRSNMTDYYTRGVLMRLMTRFAKRPHTHCTDRQCRACNVYIPICVSTATVRTKLCTFAWSQYMCRDRGLPTQLILVKGVRTMM